MLYSIAFIFVSKNVFNICIKYTKHIDNDGLKYSNMTLGPIVVNQAVTYPYPCTLSQHLFLNCSRIYTFRFLVCIPQHEIRFPSYSFQSIHGFLSTRSLALIMADNFPDISTIAVVDDSPLGQPTPNSLDSGDNVSTELAPLQQNSGAGSNDLPDKIPQSQLLASDLSESEMIAEFREQDSNLIDIINSMEADRNKFLAHVRTKISCKETEFEVYIENYHSMMIRLY